MTALGDLPPAARGEEEGATLLYSQTQAAGQHGAQCPDFAEIRAGPGFRRDPQRGKRLRCHPDPRAVPGQRCQPVLPKCTALLGTAWPGLLALQSRAPVLHTERAQRVKGKGG